MKRNTRKGFTGIELVIVIAIIAILAASLIPSFGGLINSANETADTQLVKNLNMALLSDLDGADTMSEALALAYEYGYDVAKINAKATGNEILWDSVDNVFCYLNDGEIEYISDGYELKNNVEYWVISDVPSATYSTYLYGYTGDGSEVITTGLDVGNCTLSSITYSYGFPQTISIRTNGGTLFVNNDEATVYHYGDAEAVFVTAVDTENCYHEFGNVERLEVIEGKVIVAKDATVNTMIIDEANVANVQLEVSGEVNTLYAATGLEITGKTLEVSTRITGENNTTWTLVSTKEDLIAALEAEEPKIALRGNIEFDQDYAEGCSIFTLNYPVELNLNGYTISARLVCDSSDSAKNNELFKVTKGGDLTISGSGKIVYEQVGNNFGWNASSSAISVNQSNVTVSGSAIIQHLGGTDMAYAIDVLTNGTNGDASLTVNAGLIQSPYRAIRGFCNSTTNVVSITINGGKVVSTNNRAIWMQNPSAKANKGSLTITGGVIEAKTYPIYVWENGGDFDCTVNVTGGLFYSNGQITKDHTLVN